MVDNDVETNADYTLSLQDTTLPFKIDSNSELQVGGNLNAETYDVVVVATDHGDDPLSSNVTVMVQVEPKNDYNPVFDETEYVFEFDETAIGVGSELSFDVTDQDIGEPGTVDVALVPSEYSSSFNISAVITADKTTVKLTVAEPFDRETISTFVITIEAFDTGYTEFRRTSEVNVTIVVSDVNDHSPAFVEDTFFAVVGENASSNHQFFQVMATDNDTDVDSQLEYTLENHNDVFSIGNSSGWLSVTGRLDRKVINKYVLNVKVTDSAGNFDTATVNVTVTEVNDYAPHFMHLPTEPVTIAENGNYSLIFSVYDDDSELAGEFSVSVEPAAYFELVDKYMYMLRLHTQLDYETASTVEVTITATDMGEPMLSNATVITVLVDDINEFAPVFSENEYRNDFVLDVAQPGEAIICTCMFCNRTKCIF